MFTTLSSLCLVKRASLFITENNQNQSCYMLSTHTTYFEFGKYKNLIEKWEYRTLKYHLRKCGCIFVTLASRCQKSRDHFQFCIPPHSRKLTVILQDSSKTETSSY